MVLGGGGRRLAAAAAAAAGRGTRRKPAALPPPAPAGSRWSAAAPGMFPPHAARCLSGAATAASPGPRNPQICPRPATRAVLSPSVTSTRTNGVHVLARLPFNCAKGVPPFLSAAAVDVIYNQHQRQLLKSLNYWVDGTPDAERSLYDVMMRSCTIVDSSHIFNFASQAWNTDFFLQQLTPEKKLMNAKLETLIIDNWGSVGSFKADFKNYALSLFGCGWTWLVKDSYEQLRIVNTYNAGTPLIPIRLQNLDSNVAETTASTAEHDPESPGLPYPVLRERARDAAPGTFKPLLCLNMWQHAYLHDYGWAGRGQYVDNFWDAVNWDKVSC